MIDTVAFALAAGLVAAASTTMRRRLRTRGVENTDALRVPAAERVDCHGLAGQDVQLMVVPDRSGVVLVGPPGGTAVLQAQGARRLAEILDSALPVPGDRRDVGPRGGGPWSGRRVPPGPSGLRSWVP